MGSFFNTIIVDPLYNILIATYNIIPPHDFGIAIIVTTIIIKIGMLHLSKKQIENQKKMQELQPEIKALQKKFKNNKEVQTKELLALYKKHNTTPVSGCIPIIVQLIIFIAFYRILFTMTGSEVIIEGSRLYSFVPNPEIIISTFLGVIDLGNPSPLLAVLAAAGQYYQMKMMMAKQEKAKKDQPQKKEVTKKDDGIPNMQDFAETMTKQMLYIAPALTLFIGFTFHGGLALYWLVSTVFMIAQQFYIAYKEGHEATTNKTA